MRHKKLVVLLVLAAVAVAVLAGVALVSREPAPSAAQEPSPSPTVNPPAWLLEDMARLTRNAGDPHASAWWTLTTAEKAVVVEGEDAPAQVSNPDRAVYLSIVYGDFTRWLWSLPYGTSAPTYSWVFEIIDAKSHIADVVGNSEKGFDTTGLTMQSAVLPAQVPGVEPTTSASTVSGTVVLRQPDGEDPGSDLVVTAHSPRSDAPSATTRTGPDGSFCFRLKPGWYLLSVDYWGAPATQVRVGDSGVTAAPIVAPSRELAQSTRVVVNDAPGLIPPRGVWLGNHLALLKPVWPEVSVISRKRAIAAGLGGDRSARAVLAVVSAPQRILASKGPMRNWLTWVVVGTTRRPFNASTGGGPGNTAPPYLALHRVSLIDAHTGKFLLGFFTR